MLPIPVRYEPSMETIDEHEAKTIQSLIETTERIQAIVAADVGRANRGVHAKAHGLLVGEFGNPSKFTGGSGARSVCNPADPRE